MKTNDIVHTHTNGNPQPQRRASNLILKCDYREEAFEHWPRPEPLQLAQLAAQLARAGKDSPQELVQLAWALYWEGCRQLKEDYQKVEDYLAHMAWLEESDCPDEETEPELEIPRPKKYPVTLQEMELLLLPHYTGRTDRRAEVIRAYIRERVVSPRHLQKRRGRRSESEDGRRPAPSEDEVAAIIGRWKRGQYGEEEYVRFARSFLIWYAKHADEKTRAIKAENARRGWKKRWNEKNGKLGARPKHKALREILDPPKKTS